MTEIIRARVEDPLPRVAVQDLEAPGGAAMVGHLAGTVAERLQAMAVSLSDFAGFDDTGSTSINACLALAKAACDALTVSPDAAGPRVRAKLVVPPGTYLLTADAELPLHVECQGRFTGVHSLTLTNVKRPSIRGLSCHKLKISGSWFGLFEDFYGLLDIDGGGVGFGTFWNTFTRCQADVVIDLGNWSVNQNKFNGRGNFTTVGSGPDVLDGHANNADDWDFTGGQCSNTSSLQQDSILVATYYEAGADVVGPYHMFGFQGDSGGPPRVGRMNHALGSYGVIEKNRADFLATGANILAGGAWGDLDSAGKPPCLTANNIAAAVATDHTEPFGMGAKFGGAAAAAFSNFTITVPPCPTGQFSLVLSYQGDDFANVEVQRGGGGGTSSGGESVITVDAANGWKVLRLSGRGSKTAPTSVVLFALTSAGSKNIHIGGMYATWEKAAQFPAPAYVREAHGRVVQGYVSGAGHVDIAVTFPRAFASVPVVLHSIEASAPQSPNWTKVTILSATASGFIARVNYVTDWAGALNWFARGVR